MTIEHIVISSGGAKGFIYYGALKYLNKSNFWNYDNIKTIYGTSVGALIACIISLQIDWDTLDDYLINRPWNKLVNLEPNNLLLSIQKKGLLHFGIEEKFLKPLFLSKDLSIDITLKDLFEKTNIELHFYTINLNDSPIKIIDLSYKTHPDLRAITAVGMSIALPGVIRPIIHEGGCYVDGGILNYKPINNCIEQTKCSLDSILVIENIEENWDKNGQVSDDTNIFEFYSVLTNKVLSLVNNENKLVYNKNIPNRVKILSKENDSKVWYDVFTSKELREKYINRGGEHAELFETYRNNSAAEL